MKTTTYTIKSGKTFIINKGKDSEGIESLIATYKGKQVETIQLSDTICTQRELDNAMEILKENLDEYDSIIEKFGRFMEKLDSIILPLFHK